MEDADDMYEFVGADDGMGGGAATDEVLGPTPDVHALFRFYNRVYFDGRLDTVFLEYSSARMTSCAGKGGQLATRGLCYRDAERHHSERDSYPTIPHHRPTQGPARGWAAARAACASS